MDDKFNDKYRIRTSRLQNWNYASIGYYCVTICTYNRTNYFGEIADGKMQLSKIGKTAQQYWLEIPKHYPMVKLDEFIVMPNHIHGIIVINDKNNTDMMVETPQWGVSTKHATPPTKHASLPTTPGGDNRQWKPNSLGSIINQFKSICTKRIRQSQNIDFKWQTRFYDHIIRDEKSLNSAREYIVNNPGNWENDKEVIGDGK